MKHGRPQWGEEANVGAAPLKNYENKGFAIYSSLWGAFSPCEGLSATFFRHVGAFFATFFTLWEAFLRCGGLFWLAPHPTKISASTHEPCHDINLKVKFVENVSTFA